MSSVLAKLPTILERFRSNKKEAAVNESDNNPALEKALLSVSSIWRSSSPEKDKEKAWINLIVGYPRLLKEIIITTIEEIKNSGSWYASSSSEALQDIAYYYISLMNPKVIDDFCEAKFQVKILSEK